MNPSNDIPFSRFFKALHFLAATLLVSFRFKDDDDDDNDDDKLLLWYG